MTPPNITVIIEGDDTEKKARMRLFNHEYNAGLYETDDGREFYVDPELIKVSESAHEPVPIPLQVITHREAMLEKMSWAEQAMRDQARAKETNLILPNDYRV